MQIAIQVIKCYVVETEGGDTTDPASVKAHLSQVEQMQSTEIERTGKLTQVTTENAEVVGPSDDVELDSEQEEGLVCHQCGERFERDDDQTTHHITKDGERDYDADADHVPFETPNPL